MVVLPLSSAPAAVAFRDAALRLDKAQPNDESWGPAAHDAALSLVALAEDGDDSLAVLLGPMPHPTWIVLCYQPGDVTPVETVDFTDPAAAILRCADCGNEDHVHTELVVADGEGIAWTALIRHRDDLEFEPPDLQTVVNDSGDAGRQAAVLAEWRNQLARWERRAALGGSGSRSLRPPTLGQRVESRLEELERRQAALQEEVAGLREDLREVLRLVTEQHNASVSTVARALRDRWVK